MELQEQRRLMLALARGQQSNVGIILKAEMVLARRGIWDPWCCTFPRPLTSWASSTLLSVFCAS